jgi:hypothetical protein
MAAAARITQANEGHTQAHHGIRFVVAIKKHRPF